MSLSFTVLASGSAGNASLVQAGDFGVLLDSGLGPRQLTQRLAAAGLSWACARAVLLTHTHSDHWNDATLAFLRRHRVPLYCHPAHHAALAAYAPSFAGLAAAGLVRPFAAHEDFAPVLGLRCRALPVRHDGGATFGFRVEGQADLFGRATAVGYVADLGCWDDDLAGRLADVDLLAVEFNHDVDLERRSGRSARLVARVLGDEGHLSNAQGADLVRAVLARSAPGRLRHLVQLHLSRDCNTPDLARLAARAALAGLTPPVALHTACQDAPGVTLRLGGAPARPRRAAPRARRAAQPHPWLPGLDPAGAAPEA